jgi:hypothetical protein
VNRHLPYKSDFARELEEIEEDLRQLRTSVATTTTAAATTTTSNENETKKAEPIHKIFAGSVPDSDTSGDDFIEIGHRVKPRTKIRKKYYGSALNLSSDVDSLYESSSGGGKLLAAIVYWQFHPQFMSNFSVNFYFFNF